MTEARKSQQTNRGTDRRADRRAAAVITGYIHELAAPSRRPTALQAAGEGRSS